MEQTNELKAWVKIPTNKASEYFNNFTDSELYEMDALVLIPADTNNPTSKDKFVYTREELKIMLDSFKYILSMLGDLQNNSKDLLTLIEEIKNLKTL